MRKNCQLLTLFSCCNIFSKLMLIVIILFSSSIQATVKSADSVFVFAEPVCGIPPGQTAGNCLNDLAGFNNPTCTAGDVKINKFNVISGPATCVSGTIINVELQAETIANANERYNIGYFIALDGGNAKTGLCYDDYLPPPLSLAATPSGSMRTSPFYNANGDLCGDLEQGVINLRNIGGATVSSGPQGPPVMLAIPCLDLTGNGMADVNACTSWENNKNLNTCTSIAGTIPSTPSKCDCGPVQVGNISVMGCINNSDCPLENLCTTPLCVLGTCSYVPVVCTPLDQCHLAGICNPVNGLCTNPEKPDGSTCDTGVPCFTNDTCQSGVCMNGTPVTCTNPGICQLSPGTCGNNICNYPTAPDDTPCGPNSTCQGGICVSTSQCQTGADCPVQTCQTATCPAGTCIYTTSPDGTTCGFNNVCSNGMCVECTVDSNCPEIDVCIIATCTPNHTCNFTPRDCSSGGTNCTINYCDPINNPDTGCVHRPTNDLCGCGDQCKLPVCGPNGCMLELLTGTPCDDGSACTTKDTCNNGECSGINTCIAPNTCSTASCATGQCIITGNCVCPEFCDNASPTGTCLQCDARHPCPDRLVCDSGVCVGCTSTADCTGGDACTIPSCVNNKCRYNIDRECYSHRHHSGSHDHGDSHHGTSTSVPVPVPVPVSVPVSVPLPAPILPAPLPVAEAPVSITVQKIPVENRSLDGMTTGIKDDNSRSVRKKSMSCATTSTDVKEQWMWVWVLAVFYALSRRGFKLKYIKS